SIIASIKAVRADMVIRLCSRIPVVNPERITEALSDALSEYSGIWFITHFNHAAELTDRSVAAVGRLIKRGIPVMNQTVLLREVNDDLERLKDLFQTLLQHGVKPYYLFQGDLAAGTSHLRVPLNEALELTSQLKNEISGMAMPRFAVDLPGGGGKITLPSQSHPIKESGDFYIIKGLDNEEYRYPAN
ncbi:MAG TPA: KamA family radical SAM protein, partial [Spirochaeta sp.]|nr:KamA family radical SAM protein [Spirochaeta sp.]